MKVDVTLPLTPGVAQMGKAAKKQKKKRFDPLARPSNAPAPMDEDGPGSSDSKPLSAHQQRHLERKRLQAEVKSIKKQKLKVSKADKLAWKKEKKQLTKSLRAVQAEAVALKNGHIEALPVAEQTAGFLGFDLPTPVPAHGLAYGNGNMFTSVTST